MAKKVKDKERKFMQTFNVSEVARLAGIDYHRIHHIIKGHYTVGFTSEEKEAIAKIIVDETNQDLARLGISTKIVLD